MTNLTRKDKEDIVFLYTEFKTPIHKIREKYRTTFYKISSVLREFGIKPEQKPLLLKIDPQEYEKILERYALGETCSSIAKSYNVMYNVIVKILKKRGQRIKRSGEYRSVIKPETKEKIMFKFLSGESTAKIRRDMRICTFTVLSVLKENGVSQLRTKESPCKFKVKDGYFDSIDTEEKAYILGYWFADGNVSNTNNVMSITLHSKDKDILNKMGRELFWGDFNVRSFPVKKGGQTHCRLRFVSKQIKNSLSKLGCVPNKSLILKFPSNINIPKHLMPHFVRGHFDGDGSIFISGNRKMIDIVGTFDFIFGLKDFLEMEGIVFFKPIKRNNIYSLRSSNRLEIRKFYEFLYGTMKSDFFLSRKKEKFEQELKTKGIIE